MQTQANYQQANRRVNGESSHGEILEAVGALRDYMRSMDAQVKELVHERTRLNAEVDRLRSQRSDGHWESEAHRVTDELDQLVRLYETASRRRARPHRRAEQPTPSGDGSPDNGAWFRKMMMFLMMTELA